MSFFGFDTSTIPGGGRGGGDSLDEKLRRLAEADENLEVYDWDAGGLGGLDESLDDFNDDTFATGGATVGKDFDFAGQTNTYLGGPGGTARSTQGKASTTATRSNASPFGFFDADPLLGPVRSGSAQQKQAPSQQQQQQRTSSNHYHQPLQYGPNASYATASPSIMAQQQQQQAQKPRVRTLEEIEAELQAQSRPSPSVNAGLQRQHQQGMPTPSPGQGQAKTLEEIEAEMMRTAQQQQQPSAALYSQRPPQQAQVMNLVQERDGQASQHSGPMGVLGSATRQPPQQQMQPQQSSLTEQQQAAQSMLDQLFPSLPGQPNAAAGISLSDPALLQTVEARIAAQEALEAIRRRKAGKIHRMAKYNNLMTQGDKDFITRIQVSQLINSAGPGGSHDPYVDDFYYQVMQSLKVGRMQIMEQQQQQQAMQNQQAQQQQRGPGRGRMDRQQTGEQKRMTRRENAMNRMAQQVQRIVDDAKKKPRATQLSLEGALGKIAIRTRSAPRPLLQVDGRKEDETSANSAANHLSSSLNTGAPRSAQQQQGAALTKRQVLIAIEHVYDLLLQLEQSRRALPSLNGAAQAELAAEQSQRTTGMPAGDIPSTARQALADHEISYSLLVDKVWKGIKVMDPLDVATPHPFIALLGPTKGKKLLPRVLRHLDQKQTLTLLTLLVATFDSLDVVKDGPILDVNPNDPMFNASSLAGGRKTRKTVEAETETFLNATIPLVMGTIGRAQLRIVTGMMGLLIERNDLIKLAKTKPGLAFLTLFLSRAQILKETTAASEENPVAEAQEVAQWNATFNHLLSRLSGHLPSLFPSTRSIPFGPGIYTHQSSAQSEAILDVEDGPVWHFLAALAVSSDMNQQQALVTEVREKVLENVMKAKHATRVSPGEAGEAIASAKIANVNTFLHALGLDASQITVE